MKETAISGVHASGAGFRPGAKGAARHREHAVAHALTSGITDGTRGALLIAAGFVTIGMITSMLIPRIYVAGVDDVDLTIDRWRSCPTSRRLRATDRHAGRSGKVPGQARPSTRSTVISIATRFGFSRGSR